MNEAKGIKKSTHKTKRTRNETQSTVWQSHIGNMCIVHCALCNRRQPEGNCCVPLLLLLLRKCIRNGFCPSNVKLLQINLQNFNASFVVEIVSCSQLPSVPQLWIVWTGGTVIAARRNNIIRWRWRQMVRTVVLYISIHRWFPTYGIVVKSSLSNPLNCDTVNSTQFVCCSFFRRFFFYSSFSLRVAFFLCTLNWPLTWYLW